jgi:hypothetical protein
MPSYCISRFKTLAVVLITTAFLCASVSAQEYDIQKIHKLKSQLWILLERAGIQSAIDPTNLTEDQIKTLASITKINDYPIYTMTYFGDYGFDEFLKIGHPEETSGAVLEGCSCFAGLNRNGAMIYGRNLDLTSRYPILIMYTDPPNGYASISTNIGIDIEYYLNDSENEENIEWVLVLPFFSHDGLNEHGVAIAGLNVQGERVYDPAKVSLSRFETRRLVLDHARTVNEAVDLLRQYNNTSSDGVHYLISDAFGDSAVVEYYDGTVKATRNVEPWQAATNFLLKGAAPDAVLGRCVRYDTLYQGLWAYWGLVSRWEGMQLLAAVARYQEPAAENVFVYTVWSSVYDMTRGHLNVYPGTQYGSLEEFDLDMVNDLKVLTSRMNPGNLSARDAFKITTRISNLSPRPSKKGAIKYYLSSTKKLDDEAVLLGIKKLGAVKSRKKKTLRLRRQLRPTLSSGSYYLVTVLDEEGVNNDPNPDNNRFVSKKLVNIR